MSDNRTIIKDGETYSVIDSGSAIVPSIVGATITMNNYHVKIYVYESESKGYNIQENDEGLLQIIFYTNDGMEYQGLLEINEISNERGTPLSLDFQIKRVDNTCHVLFYTWLIKQ